jgi:hypothetical protein
MSLEAMADTHTALILRNGPVLAPVWVMEDEYKYSLNINLVRNGCDHSINLIIWKGVNAHHPPTMSLGTGSTETDFTWLSTDDGQRITLDSFRRWVAKALGADA